jgi:hypothetical protein
MTLFSVMNAVEKYLRVEVTLRERLLIMQEKFYSLKHGQQERSLRQFRRDGQY